jgi:hypothetical protein
MTNLVVAMISSNTSLATQEATQVLIDLTVPGNRATGLKVDSAVK